MNSNKKVGKPRSMDIRSYNVTDTGTRTFDISKIDTEMKTVLNPVRRGNVYVGTEFEGHEVVILVMRKKHGSTNNA